MQLFNRTSVSTTPVTSRLTLATAGVALAVASAFGQSSTPFDSRYGSPPSNTIESADASVVEPLLSYRRPDAGAADAAAETPRAMLGTQASADGSNPLRPQPEPAPQPAPFQPAPIANSVAPPITNAIPNSELATPAAELPTAAPPISAAPLIRYDSAIQPASHEADPPALPIPTPLAALSPKEPENEEQTRRLAPFSTGSPFVKDATPSDAKSDGPLPFSFSKLESFSTAGVGLAIVVGLFLICMWMLRRGGARTSGVLPSDAFAVLGRAPLTSQSFAHLLRLGNKLVLVAMSSDGIQPLTEVTDPMEVDRLTGLCASGRGHGPTAEFQQVLSQLAREPARGFLGAEADGGRRR
jgi:flagellar biogenesis protein FliO